MTCALIDIIHEYLMHNYNQFVHHSYNLLSFVWQKKSTENTAHNHGQKENDFLELHRKMISHVHYFWGIVTTQYEH